MIAAKAGFKSSPIRGSLGSAKFHVGGSAGFCLNGELSVGAATKLGVYDGALSPGTRSVSPKRRAG